VQYLCEKGADLYRKNDSGQTAISWAAENGHEAIALILAEQGEVRKMA
jgi:ankyrin repeat protein